MYLCVMGEVLGVCTLEEERSEESERFNRPAVG